MLTHTIIVYTQEEETFKITVKTTNQHHPTHANFNWQDSTDFITQHATIAASDHGYNYDNWEHDSVKIKWTCPYCSQQQITPDNEEHPELECCLCSEKITWYEITNEQQ